MKRPVVELSECLKCELCTDVSPLVFILNSAGYIEVADLAEYPENEVADAVKYCPVNCIHIQ